MMLTCFLTNRPALPAALTFSLSTPNTTDVVSVHPDLPLFAAHWPNDPDFRQEWGTKRIGSTNAWNIMTGARNPQDALTVCIIDSGIDYM